MNPLERRERVTISTQLARTPPTNPEAEESVIGAMLLRREVIEDVIGILDPSDFYDVALGHAYDAILSLYDHGDAIDSLTVANAMLARDRKPPDLLYLMSNVPSVSSAARYAKLVKETKVAREVIRLCGEATERLYQRDDPYDLVDDLDRELSSIDAVNDRPEAMTIWEMEAMSESDAPWIVPGLLKRDWRAIVTGGEGAGKGVLLRTMAIATAGGYHLFTHRAIEPQRTLMVDLENPRQAVLETGTVIAQTVKDRSIRDGRPYDPTAFRIWHRPGGIDIRTRADRSELVREIAWQEPQLVCVGPYYKLTRPRKGENWEDAALGALGVLDELRTKYGFALVIEAHSPKASGGHRRMLIPMGSIYLSAWPEIGIGLRLEDEDEENPLSDTLLVEKFRGDRLKCNWPTKVLRDPDWVVSGVFTGSVDF